MRHLHSVLLLCGALHIVPMFASNVTETPSTRSPTRSTTTNTTTVTMKVTEDSQTNFPTTTEPQKDEENITSPSPPTTTPERDWTKNDGTSQTPRITPTTPAINGDLKNLNLSTECEKQIFNLFRPLLSMKNQPSVKDSISVGKLFKLPVGRLIDSWGKIPSRLLDGQFVWLGAYDECKRIPDVKYCLVDTKIMQKYDGKFGTCMPSRCTSADVGKIQPVLGELVLRTQGLVEFTSSVSCEKEIEYSVGFYATVFLFALTLLFIVIGTILDLLDPKQATQQNHHIPLTNMTNSLHQNGVGNDNSTDNTEERTLLTASTTTNNNNKDDGTLSRSQERKPKKPMLFQFLTCYSLVRNVKAIISTHVPRGAIECINGIRAISMFWVILGHVFAFGAMANMHDTLFVTIETLLRRYSFQIIANAYFSVDTFFVLSGLLVAYLSLKKMDKMNGKLNLLMYYAHRIIRITPPYLYVILFWNNIFRYTIRGPMAEEQRKKFGDDGQCYQYWWTNLLYINNFYPKQINKECLGWSWYLANDMQFYIIAPVFLYFMFHWERKFQRKWYRNVGPFCIVVVGCVISVGVRGALLAYKNYEALMTNPKMLMDPHLNEERQDALYVKPYTRISPYLIGLFLGYILSRNVSIISGKQKIIKVIAWLISFLLGMAVVYGPYISAYKTEGDHFNFVENVVYGSVAALVWAITVSWVIYACHNGFGGYINSILSWPIWMPLSRLTFGAYLLHPIVIFYANWVRETPYHYQDNLIVFDITSIGFLSYAAAFILSVAVEVPIANMEKLIFKI